MPDRLSLVEAAVGRYKMSRRDAESLVEAIFEALGAALADDDVARPSSGPRRDRHTFERAARTLGLADTAPIGLRRVHAAAGSPNRVDLAMSERSRRIEDQAF